jgi:hypothetical protein
MSVWRPRLSAGRLLTGIAVLLAMTAAGCARPDSLADEARAVEPGRAKTLDSAYFKLLSAEKCARRATDQQAVAEQLYRISQVAARAQAAGLGQGLLDTRARWTRFDETADWVCGTGDPLANLRAAVEAFDKAVAEAIAGR